MEQNDHTDPNADSDGEFAFETDHLALRTNTDYCEMLKYIVKLESQKAKVLQDLEYLADAEKKALEDPIKFVQELKAGNVNFPVRQTIPNLPNIDWDSYGIDSVLETEESKPSKNNTEEGPKVRGRAFTDSKPESFNQLWSVEEQKRLEELLEIYPEEPVEARRFKKIAEALGTRTVHQVMSRIQKYFAKLAKAGLPIPGRAPKGIVKDHRSNIFYRKSTFFPQLHVPVKMEEHHDSDAQEGCTADTKGGDKSMINMLKAAKEQRLLDERSPVWQIKSRCVGCQKTGFLGARWTDNAGTDYCTDCFVKLLPPEKLTPVREVH